MNLALSLRSELLKTRRTATFYFTLVGAAVVPFIFLLNVLFDDDLMDATRKNPLNGIFTLNAQLNGQVIFPWFVILACTLLPQIEYRNATWKQVLTSPQSKAQVFFAKFLSIQGLILFYFVANHLFLWITVILGHFIRPEIGFFSASLDGYAVLRHAVNSYLMVLGLCAAQFWLGLRFRNFIVPVALGLVLWLAGTLLAAEIKSAAADYFPYAFHLYPHFPLLQPKLETTALISFVYALVFLGLGFGDFRRRRLG